VLLSAADGTIVDFDLVAANALEREAALALLEANPIDGATIICAKGFAAPTSKPPCASCAPCRCAQADTTSPNGPSHHLAGSGNGSNRSSTASKTNSCSNATAAAPPAGLLTRVAARILALWACINLNQRLGLPSRELSPYAEPINHLGEREPSPRARPASTACCRVGTTSPSTDEV
jgi:hypothetical protein